MKITLAPLLLALVSAVLVSADMRKHLFDNPHAKRANIDHLGRRDTSKNGMPYPEPGTHIPAQMPQAWRDKLKQAEDAGKIPNIPPSKTNMQTELSIYPAGVKDSELCSWTNTQCIPQGAISETPAKTVGMAVDDGPVTDAITSVEPIVQEHKVSMSHFLIGSQILWDVPAMTRLAQMDPPQHLCSHSFTHTFMTNHTNEQVVADLGWSMQLIYDYSGKIPLYWRPPAGDVDNRVTAIAKEVLGMQLVMWNRDTFDWCTLNDGSIFKGGGCEGVTKDKYERDIDGWVSGGAGIVPLAHEARKSSAPYFKMLIEKAIAKGYSVGPIPHAQSLPWYQNANDASDKGTPSAQDSILPTKQPFTVKDKGATTEGGVDWGDWKKGASTGTVAGNTSTTGSGSSTTSSSTTSTGNGTSSSSSGSGTTANPTPSGGDTIFSGASVTVAFMAASLVAAIAACF